MNIKNPSRKQFTAMFCQAMKLTSIMAVLALVCFLFLTFIDYDIYEPDSFRKAAHFFNDLRWNGIKYPANLAFIGAGLLNGMLCFNFAWSKKQSNVVLSLGMKKSDIYFAKILGGIVPMAVTFLLAGVAETISNAAGNFIVDSRFFAMAAFTMLQYLAIYILSFTLSSAVMANTGNVVEGVIFTFILAVFPMTVKSFLAHTFWQFTHGAYISPEGPGFNWSNPFQAFHNLEYEFMQTYFYNNSAILPSFSITQWSGTIMAFVYAAVVVLLGYLGFRKRRNEICGTWGRAKGMNEIAGAFTGFYSAILLGLIMFNENHGNASFLTYLTCCGSFVLAYVIFKIVFGYKRKKEVKTAINRIPVYAIGFAVVFMVFSLGFFSYSSKIPEASEVKSVKVSSPYYKTFDEAFSGSSEYALKLTVLGYTNTPDFDGSMYMDVANSPNISFSEYSDIEKVIKIHESFVREGKIKNNGAHSCATNVMITYTLKNGKEITRYYTESTEGTTLKLLQLNDSSEFNKILFEYLKYCTGFDLSQEAVPENGEDGYVEITDDGEYIESEAYEKIIENFTYHNSALHCLADKPCYIFPTDMSSGYKLGYIEKDLYTAIITDLKNKTANQYFNHSTEDEVGVLSFGLSNSSYILSGSYDPLEGIIYQTADEKAVSDRDIITEEDNHPDGSLRQTSWNINSSDIKAIVITKDMKNTLEYLEEHDLMKHFERTLNAQDVKSVRLATMGELCDGSYDNSEIFPIFYGGFWTSQQMSEWVRENSIHKYYNYFFENIHNEITDRKQIEKLLGQSVIFGYCANDSRIMEITYKDGSVATVMVRAQ
ncbi:MAG: hypothetical protein IKJ69_01175 [Clostridia bacterium]|nr:hypothetical protein [Clostridia bacterium]